jgi:arabinan endo-1,5-alpha-L-arabinosidase
MSPMSGGGTLLVQGDASWVAPGHNAVITYDNKTYKLSHALEGSSSGAATLRIGELVWDAKTAGRSPVGRSDSAHRGVNGG